VDQVEYVPSDTANLPPLGPTDDLLHSPLTPECLDKMYRSLIARGHGDNEANGTDPGWGGRAYIRERLKFLYSVS
jgi:hypothetical protein